MFLEARFVKAMLRKYELCVNLLGSRGRLWPASAPVGVPVGAGNFRGAGSSSAPAVGWSWELEHKTGAGF